MRKPITEAQRRHLADRQVVASVSGGKDSTALALWLKENGIPFIAVFLGTHKPDWLKKTDVPLFLSARRLRPYRRLPRSIGSWALDSGGFSELSLFGRWETSPKEYVREVKRYQEEIGGLLWASIQDFMCEEAILQKTGLTIARHQQLTVENYETLLSLAPELPWMPVLQGFSRADYLRCLELYALHDVRGHDLVRAPVVGVGSMCRRQGTREALCILSSLHSQGLSLHAFGFKVQGLSQAAHLLQSSDSLAWSFHARRKPALPGCSHKNCANCLPYALRWYAGLLHTLSKGRREQLSFWLKEEIV